ncbi:putative oxido C1F5.03c [Cyphellophora attinorum]|uniref:Putative oxido C1F5.03c n=1 Tax=Cyphellophora attinorum TaxID=1664694 RepID=A0A0N1P1D3_9EURO|nr:putative oxido C1F5.03c [Phialophora attinorum]KPI44196.1 putative oxido C1F5.03c [Phialophora attinorum]
MATVIIGGGIIGLATAYYLSEERPPVEGSNPSIHVVDSSHSLLLSASGHAGGFLAKDWFSPASASLGGLSFALHRRLADEHDGFRKWGYVGTRTYSLSIDERGVGSAAKQSRGEDWVTSGTSRAGVAPANAREDSAREQNAIDATEMLNPDGSRHASRHSRLFLIEKCKARSVEFHLSTTPLGIETDPKTNNISGLSCSFYNEDRRTTNEDVLPCNTLIMTAGAWTPAVFKTLFPSSKLRIPISPLAGTSLLARSPRYTTPFSLDASATDPSRNENHSMGYAIYCSPMPPTFRGHRYSYAPEAFARLGPDSRPEIWIGGLNHPHLSLPKKAEDVEALRQSRGTADVDELRKCLVQLCGKVALENSDARNSGLNEDDLDIVRQGLCFRPVSQTGVPLIGRLDEKLLGSEIKKVDSGGVFIASGHGPWGISLSLGTGEQMITNGQQRTKKVDPEKRRDRTMKVINF